MIAICLKLYANLNSDRRALLFFLFLRGANVGIPGWEMHSCPTSNKLQGRSKSIDDFCLEQHILIILTYCFKMVFTSLYVFVRISKACTIQRGAKDLYLKNVRRGRQSFVASLQMLRELQVTSLKDPVLPLNIHF